MSFLKKIDTAIENLEVEKTTREGELAELEKDLSDTKINPYGITNIDFSKRLELIEDITKMEGVLMGLNLAKETYAETAAQEV